MANLPQDYDSVMSRKQEVMKDAIGIDYSQFESGSMAFDYEKMMRETGYTLEEMQKIQYSVNVGNTPILELRNLTALARACAPEGKGARIFVKDEAANPSGSFKARRAANAVFHAKKLGYKGVIAATSGNYGAAVASQAAIAGLKCIIVQECYDSKGVGQPEIIEKARKCEALGAEVVQLTVGPELFYKFILLLEETGYFNASLYTPFGIAGVETLGYEISMQFREKYGKDPDVVVCTNAGGGNLTGTARGLMKAGAKDTKVIGASIDLSGLHMASDKAFNLKSCTTGHTGFGVPYAVDPDHSDVPRSAARPLRYMDRYVTITQGDVFYITECLATLEGLEKGPAGNTSLAAAFALAQEMDQDQMIVVQETEYTGAGKHVQPQLSFARENGIEVRFGDPKDEVPGKSVIIPEHPTLIKATDMDLDRQKKSLIKANLKKYTMDPTEEDYQYLAEETKKDVDWVKKAVEEIKASL
ncbi:2-amino-4-oxopentanoate thiolase subunit OrtB [Ihubacter massiliensis]|uniref:2-amino-4-oxopentanoate thiolase subunit OrtB n=1 Tax=Hominibacterium faecale TaxID=2839743 RepID=A0A9J6QTV9_9FIRM|nr:MULTISPECIES: 2-amino-4-oxopentanoate thiolase subunit OrtB [Eubacteriales Family XIII. Incertae Sedis]MCC2865757.1 PLP-dependent lyase/thiolase [Anaerovorax odorimutans]MCO7123489.1 2-amino-4-oxopentanoate thiolase subunit OrtB [Ihubacter massiliensis]MCU7379597.1 2-amino-4-oxopentanoate thiolase subunit OrtB [Hominibacterium faecale]MDE8734531.1 2-amino-4-oxopentanoate thiolase subunit OrtB [Eubacteriales bacterium DFI.9.88]